MNHIIQPAFSHKLRMLCTKLLNLDGHLASGINSTRLINLPESSLINLVLNLKSILDNPYLKLVRLRLHRTTRLSIVTMIHLHLCSPNHQLTLRRLYTDLRAAMLTIVACFTEK